MNYCIAAFAIVFIISIVQWFIDGRKNFHGPQLDLDAMKSGKVMGMVPESEGAPARETTIAKPMGSNSAMSEKLKV